MALLRTTGLATSALPTLKDHVRKRSRQMLEEMMVGFRRHRTQSRSGWGTPRPSLVVSEVVSSRLVVGPVAAAAIIGGVLGSTAVANPANPDVLNLNPRLWDATTEMLTGAA
jgi:hypothetical protein